MDRDHKLAMLLESLGDGIDVETAQQVLEAHDWDLSAALNAILGDGGRSAASARAGGATAGTAMHTDIHGNHGDGYRAPMRTGYMDTLVAAPSPEAERARELERQHFEAERREAMERQRLREAQDREAALARQVELQRAEAEREAWLRRQRKREAEEADRKRLNGGMHLEPQPPGRQEAGLPSPALLAEEQRPPPQQPVPAAQLAEPLPPMPVQSSEPPQPSEQAHPVAQPDDRHAAEARRREVLAEEELRRERQEAEERRLQAVPPEHEVNHVAQALVALKRRYHAADAAGLVLCLKTLSVYLGNLAKNPQEPKFQRINCDNSAFRSRVAAFEGAVAVLEACGFKQDGAALVVDHECIRTKGRRLWDARTKVDLLVGQLESAAA